jgi:nucleotide-binding universal stress UspA family protein
MTMNELQQVRSPIDAAQGSRRALDYARALARHDDLVVSTEIPPRADRPVLVVTPRCGPPPANAAFRRIVCALDFSLASPPALKRAVAMAGNSPSARLILVHVLEGFPHRDVAAGEAGADLGLYWTYREGHARTSLEELAERHAGACQTEVIVSSGQPWLELLDVTAERSADLVVVGSHRTGPPATESSTAARLARQAACPVLVVPR